jgi:hypothetical protein
VADFHDNEQVAGEGEYENGVETPGWTYWQADGSPDPR